MEGASIYVKELGTKIINGMGGWKQLCESMTPGNMSTYRSQMIKCGLSYSEHKLSEKLLQLTTDSVKQIPLQSEK